MNAPRKKLLFVCGRNKAFTEPALTSLLQEKMRDHFSELP
jgi:hypothetical protein